VSESRALDSNTQILLEQLQQQQQHAIQLATHQGLPNNVPPTNAAVLHAHADALQQHTHSLQIQQQQQQLLHSLIASPSVAAPAVFVMGVGAVGVEGASPAGMPGATLDAMSLVSPMVVGAGDVSPFGGVGMPSSPEQVAALQQLQQQLHKVYYEAYYKAYLDNLTPSLSSAAPTDAVDIHTATDAVDIHTAEKLTVPATADGLGGYDTHTAAPGEWSDAAPFAHQDAASNVLTVDGAEVAAAHEDAGEGGGAEGGEAVAGAEDVHLLPGMGCASVLRMQHTATHCNTPQHTANALSDT